MVLLVLNRVIIVNLFVHDKHRVFGMDIVTCECDLFILRKVQLPACYH